MYKIKIQHAVTYNCGVKYISKQDTTFVIILTEVFCTCYVAMQP